MSAHDRKFQTGAAFEVLGDLHSRLKVICIGDEMGNHVKVCIFEIRHGGMLLPCLAGAGLCQERLKTSNHLSVGMDDHAAGGEIGRLCVLLPVLFQTLLEAGNACRTHLFLKSDLLFPSFMLGREASMGGEKKFIGGVDIDQGKSLPKEKARPRNT